jgi:formate dehydrogenase iron-sulfur subunit
MLGKRIVIDTSKCIGCRACQVACKQWHSLEAEDTTFTGSYQNPPDMSGANLTVAKFTEKEEDGKLKWLFFKDQCRHCQQPMCKPSCPFGAISKQRSGTVRIDPDLCDPLRCTPNPPQYLRPCQNNCPFKNSDGLGIARWKYKKNNVVTGSKMRKCDFCYNRFGNIALPLASQRPACVDACPPGAILCGMADKMLIKAKRRVRNLKLNGYPNANVYPLLGGAYSTHVIWVLTEDPSTYGL